VRLRISRRYPRCEGSRRLGPILGPLLVPFIVAACVFDNPDYPRGWASIAKASDPCAILGGIYSEVGAYDPNSFVVKNVVGHSVVAHLSSMLGVFGAYGNRVEIVYDDERALRIRSFLDEMKVGEVLYSERDKTLSCGSEGAAINRRKAPQGHGNVLLGVETDTTFLSKATDGALVVKQSSASAGLVFMMVPAGGSQSVWSHFAPARKD